MVTYVHRTIRDGPSAPSEASSCEFSNRCGDCGKLFPRGCFDFARGYCLDCCDARDAPPSQEGSAGQSRRAGAGPSREFYHDYDYDSEDACQFQKPWDSDSD